MDSHVQPGPHPITDEELAARILRGDREAEQQLVVKFARGVRALVQAQGSSHADDVSQETMRIVLERLRTRPLDDPSKLGHFILRTAKNILFGILRSEKRRATVDIDDMSLAAPTHEEPYSAVERAEHASLVHRVIQELPTERDRRILHAFYIARVQKEQICAELELDSLHFNRVIHRARERFRELFLRRTERAVEVIHESR